MNRFKIVLVLVLAAVSFAANPEEELHGVKYANNCEACKVLAIELQNRLTETGKTHEVLEIGYSPFDESKKKKTPYTVSETRFIESLEGVCDKILEYNIHKERKDSTRFAKGMSETFQTLHGLVDKGVKVELGIPFELWDKPSAEVTQLKTQCETLLERHEEDIEDWYNHHQADAQLIDFLCRDRVLNKKDSECLYEVVKPKEKKKKRRDDDESEKNEENEEARGEEEKSEEPAEEPKEEKPKKKKNKKGEDGKVEL